MPDANINQFWDEYERRFDVPRTREQLDRLRDEAIAYTIGRGHNIEDLHSYLGVSREELFNEQTNDMGGDGSGDSAVPDAVSTPSGFYVEQSLSTNGGGRVPVPEWVEPNAVDFLDPWGTTGHYYATQRGWNHVERPIFPPNMAEPQRDTRPTERRNPNELVFSDDPVEQYHLTAISFFKGLHCPEGRGTGHRSYKALNENIVEALQGDLDRYMERLHGRTGETPRHTEPDRPARGRTR